jgi:hypothetical protein
MGGSSVVWAETPDEDQEQESPDTEAHGDIDDTFAVRRLRRWIRGMFGGAAEPPAERDPDRESDS